MRCSELTQMDDKELTHELKDQGVTEASVISVKDDDQKWPTDTVILSAYRQYQTTALRAFLFLHLYQILQGVFTVRNTITVKKRKKRSVCERCGTAGHTSMECQNAEHCINCQGPNSAASKHCPKWIFQKKFNRLRWRKKSHFFKQEGWLAGPVK